MEQFHRKLLEPGWAGCLSPDEARLIKKTLEASPALKKKWGIRGAVTLNKVARVALPEESAERRKKSPQTTKRAQNCS